MSKNKVLQNSGMSRLKAGWYILTILSLMPIVFWLFEMPLDFRFGDWSLLSRSLGDISGLVGMAMFSLVMILSARLKFFEKFFNGINESYTAHHFFGGLSLCLLLFHPLFLAYNYLLVSFESAALFLLPSASNWSNNFGIAGLFIMIITLVITFYTKLKYQVWKFTHKFLGIAFMLAFAHTFLSSGDIASNIALRAYLFVLGVLAIATFFYRTLFADYLVRVFDYTIIGVKSFPDKIWEIELQPKNRVLNFIPGQFSFVKFYSEGLARELHPFSFSSATGNPLKIAIKELGDYTNKISSLKIGDNAKVETAFGSFNFKNFKNKKQIWIAGGIGITPFLSMIRGLSNNDADYKIDLYYSVRDKECLAFQEEIKKVADIYKNLNVIFWVSTEKGFLTADSIILNTTDMKERDFLICASVPMMSALRSQLLNQGISKNKIHTEEFSMY